MHYCLMLFTKEFPAKQKIEKMMKKYAWDNNHSETHDEYPQFTYDWYEIGYRYNGTIKLKFDADSEKYRWKYSEINSRNGRLFWSYLLNEIEKNLRNHFMCHEEFYFYSMGANDGFLYVDGAWIEDITNFEELNCYTFMTDDGEAYSRDWWNGDTHINNEDFAERLKSAKDKAKVENQFVTIIDYHD
ncbi:MAG: hypothetical protein NC086_09575 [Alistipes sp.]|nr:hypothetical protein [Alistipes sp.]